ncbi:hypothetical protein M405DRAFT_882652 [Rhizopogon salebrosus TDB-379]|nr:hypothetical protein M405DRAFT_882652 [Rhizopogon salebrosus TDB-379]
MSLKSNIPSFICKRLRDKRPPPSSAAMNPSYFKNAVLLNMHGWHSEPQLCRGRCCKMSNEQRKARLSEHDRITRTGVEYQTPKVLNITTCSESSLTAAGNSRQQCNLLHAIISSPNNLLQETLSGLSGICSNSLCKTSDFSRMDKKKNTAAENYYYQECQPFCKQLRARNTNRRCNSRALEVTAQAENVSMKFTVWDSESSVKVRLYNNQMMGAPLQRSMMCLGLNISRRHGNATSRSVEMFGFVPKLNKVDKPEGLILLQDKQLQRRLEKSEMQRSVSLSIIDGRSVTGSQVVETGNALRVMNTDISICTAVTDLGVEIGFRPHLKAFFEANQLYQYSEVYGFGLLVCGAAASGGFREVKKDQLDMGD